MTKTSEKKSTKATAKTIVGFSEAKKIVRKLGWRNHQAYSWAKIERRLPKGLPERPAETYARYWKGWNDFFGVK